MECISKEVGGLGKALRFKAFKVRYVWLEGLKEDAQSALDTAPVNRSWITAKIQVYEALIVTANMDCY